MTKTKTTPKKGPDLSVKNRARIADEEVQRLIEGETSGPRFWPKVRKVFLGIVYCISVAFFGAVFSLIAVVLLPVVLPGAYILGQFKGRDPRIPTMPKGSD